MTSGSVSRHRPGTATAFQLVFPSSEPFLSTIRLATGDTPRESIAEGFASGERPLKRMRGSGNRFSTGYVESLGVPDRKMANIVINCACVAFGLFYEA